MEYIDYEAMVFALGGETVCPLCEIGVLIPDDVSEATELQCDICDELFLVDNEQD